jgi:hypothetical protein
MCKRYSCYTFVCGLIPEDYLLTAKFVYTFTHKYCDEMPESRKSGIGSEVDFLDNELLRQLNDSG